MKDTAKTVLVMDHMFIVNTSPHFNETNFVVQFLDRLDPDRIVHLGKIGDDSYDLYIFNDRSDDE